MPFASEKQRRFLWSQRPDVAREFAEKKKTMKLSQAHRNRVKRQHQLAKLQERKAAAKEKAHKRERERLEKEIAKIEKRFEPRIEKLHREMREHEHRAAEHHKEAERIIHQHGKFESPEAWRYRMNHTQPSHAERSIAENFGDDS